MVLVSSMGGASRRGSRESPLERGRSMGPLRHLLRGGERTAVQSPLLRDREPSRRGRAHPGRVPEALGAVGPDRSDRGSHRVPVPRRAERLPIAAAADGDGRPEADAGVAEPPDAFLEAEMRADVRQLLLRLTQRQRAAPPARGPARLLPPSRRRASCASDRPRFGHLPRKVGGP